MSKVCNGQGHAGRDCKAPFSKKWPGCPALKMRLRDSSGMTMEIELKLTEALYEELRAFQLDVMKRALEL